MKSPVRKIFAEGRTVGRGRVHYDPITVARFWSKVDVRKGLGDCWNWTGSKTDEYGRIKIKGESYTATRVAWELLHGRSLGKMHALHTCDNKSCCNPFHLYAGTPNQNRHDYHFAASEVAIAEGIPKSRGTKLSNYAVQYIKAALDAGLPPELLARHGEVCVATIKRIRDGHTFKDVAPRQERIAEMRAQLTSTVSTKEEVR